MLEIRKLIKLTPEVKQEVREIPLKDRPLTEQQLKFVNEYLKDSTTIKSAAIRAGYSIETASEQGTRLLKDPRVKDLIDKAKAKAVSQLGLTEARVLQELSLIAFANPGDVITKDEDGVAHVDVDRLKEPGGKGASEFSVTSMSGKSKAKVVSVKTVKNSDKITALTTLGKHLGMFKEKVEVEHTGNFLDLVQKSFLNDYEEPKEPI